MEKSVLMLLITISQSVIGDGCCKTKMVGGVTYRFKGEEETSTFSCMDKCTYAKDGEENSKYCFAEGDLQPECRDSGSAPVGSTVSAGGAGDVTGGAGGITGVAGGLTVGTGAAVAATAAGGSGCKCGVKKGSRIVGGTETEVNEYPWMAGIADISDDSSFYCGGTLIASQWVVTASHCLFKDNEGKNPTLATEVQIVLGEHDLSSTTESIIPRKKVTISKIVTHPSYNTDSSSNDIALLKLSEEVDLNVYTPSCVANTGDTFDGKNAWVYGWGTTSSAGASPNKLLEVEVPIVTNTVCDAAMGEITADKLCAGGELNKDGCQGDSGGPLTVDVSGQHVLVGDVSYGEGCGLAGKYGVYGNVAYLRAWIDTTVAANGGAKYCPS